MERMLAGAVGGLCSHLVGEPDNHGFHEGSSA